MTEFTANRERVVPDRPAGPRGLRFVALLVVILNLAGCANYRWGYQSMYRPDIRTVHVPIFESDSFRRELGERLTEAVVREIQLRTPYRVVGPKRAQSVLRGRILADGKRTVTEDLYDIPRVIETDLVAEVQWVSPTGDLLSNTMVLPIDPLFLRVGQAENLIPQGGQSVQTAYQESIQKLAEEIVNQMEVPPW